MLSKRQLKQLRSEIVMNSVFLKDYSNSLNINEKTACNFFDGYSEYIDDENLQDNINNLYDYYCIYDYDPLVRV